MDFVFSPEAKEDGYDNAIKDIKLIQKSLHSEAKFKMRHDKHQMDHHFKVTNQVWIYRSKERFKGEGKKLKSIRYGPFKIFENIGDNAFRLDFPRYIQIYSFVNVKKLKLYEPPIIMDEDESAQVPSIDDFAPKCMTKL